MVIERRAAQIGGHSSEVEAPTSPIAGRALFIGKADTGCRSTLFQHQRGDTRTRRTHIAPRTSRIANRMVVFGTYSSLSLNRKRRISSGSTRPLVRMAQRDRTPNPMAP